MAGEFISEKLEDHAVFRRQTSQFRPLSLTFKPDEVLPDTNVEVSVRGVFTSPSGTSKDLFQESLELDSLGEAHFTVTANFVTERGLLDVFWKLTTPEFSFEVPDHFLVTEFMPVFYSLREEEKSVVESVAMMFADLFDNVSGGQPAFYEEYQSSFSWERIAQLMGLALSKINLSYQPVTRFSLSSGPSLPSHWLGLLQQATYVEVVRHFIRTYVEQPNITGGSVTYADRRDYMSRWESVLQDASKETEEAIKSAKISYIGSMSSSLIVSGGRFPSSRMIGSYGAMLRGTRFVPGSYVVYGA